MSVLLDTGFIIAALNADDEHHEVAQELLARIARKEFGAPCVTDHVVFELSTLIRKRTGSAALEGAAMEFLPLPNPSLDGLSIVTEGSTRLRTTYGVFVKHRDQGLSFTDSNLILVMRERGISALATFDRRLANLVPAVA